MMGKIIRKSKKIEIERVKPIITANTMPVISEKERKARRSQLEKLMGTINKKHGENFVVFGSNIIIHELTRTDSFVVPTLDFGIGGGLPNGRVTTISGPESSCKSAIGYRYTGSYQQRQRKNSALIDVEGTYTEEWGATHGIDNSLLIYNRPASAEEGLQISLDLARTGQVQFIMLDSIDALAPTYDMGKQMGEGRILGVKATLLGEFLRKMNATNNGLIRAGKEPVTLLLINQLREKPMTMGDPEYEPGGRAIRFYSSVQIRLRRGDWIKEGTGKNMRIVGQTSKFKVFKNKTFKMLQTGEFDFYTDRNSLKLPAGSFDTAKQLVELGVAWGIIEEASQGRFIVNGKKIHGIKSVIEELRYDEDMSDSIRSQVSEFVKAHGSKADSPETREYDPETGEVLE